jgi:crotonobetainyl-CoA:carnitine CoA-transferase CaiB-like acyl-CoA transferase
MVGNPIKLSGHLDPMVRHSAPKLNEHGVAIRAEFAVDSAHGVEKAPIPRPIQM